ncbi:threonine dehydrogenase-like Zn-dependent dehydrogenase [Thermocatellispora tengchongensis]|uniref:Threonine dehydrogenase-like Zn-dependent dehydrogenase n=1 Tax=Thermocatellispora tengchongensis TaxID=1073253 RepID=A0A840P7I9_9ACTN|nr:threonine dehydrogenase-like Zn-dependent dehydrogenase [Thermocatellispora tengchongensis]
MTAETLRRPPEGVDAIVNAALRGQALIEAARALRAGGRLVSTTPGTPDLSAFGRDDISVTVVDGPPTVTAGTFPSLAARALGGTLPDPISRRFRFEEAVQAYCHLASPQHTHGKIVVSMA